MKGRGQVELGVSYFANLFTNLNQWEESISDAEPFHGCISFFRHLKFPTQFLSEKWNTICHTFPTSRFFDISIFRQFFKNKLMYIPKFEFWICFTYFIQYHLKVDFTHTYMYISMAVLSPNLTNITKMTYLQAWIDSSMHAELKKGNRNPKKN